IATRFATRLPPSARRGYGGQSLAQPARHDGRLPLAEAVAVEEELALEDAGHDRRLATLEAGLHLLGGESGRLAVDGDEDGRGRPHRAVVLHARPDAGAPIDGSGDEPGLREVARPLGIVVGAEEQLDGG